MVAKQVSVPAAPAEIGGRPQEQWSTTPSVAQVVWCLCQLFQAGGAVTASHEELASARRDALNMISARLSETDGVDALCVDAWNLDVEIDTYVEDLRTGERYQVSLGGTVSPCFGGAYLGFCLPLKVVDGDDRGMSDRGVSDMEDQILDALSDPWRDAMLGCNLRTRSIVSRLFPDGR